MFTSIAEQYVNRYAGRFLRYFSAEHQFQLSLNTLTLRHLELNVQELKRIHSSYKLKKCFIGEIVVDLSFLLFGGKLDVTVNDIVVIVERQDSTAGGMKSTDESTTTSRGGADSEPDEATEALDTLQMLITLFYLSLLSSNQKTESADGVGDEGTVPQSANPFPALTSHNLYSLQRLLEKISLTINRIHVRIEEDFTSHVKNIEYDTMIGAFFAQTIILRTATVHDLQRDSAHFLDPATLAASTSSSTDGPKNLKSKKSLLISNKIISIEEYFLVCRRTSSCLEELHSELLDTLGDINAATVLSSSAEENALLAKKGKLTADFFRRKFDEEKSRAMTAAQNNDLASQGVILRPTTVECLLAVAFQHRNRVFGPVKCHCRVHHVDWHLTDEQLLFAFRLIEGLHEFQHRLQTRARRALIRRDGSNHIVDMFDNMSLIDAESKRVRARLRWKLIRHSIAVDWSHFIKQKVRDDDNSAMRWRSWYQTWRLAARYVALREILMFHVGYETFQFGERTLSLAEKLDVDEWNPLPNSSKLTSTTHQNKIMVGERLKLYFTSDEAAGEGDPSLSTQGNTTSLVTGRRRCILMGEGNIPEEDLAMAEQIIQHQLTRNLTRRPAVDPHSIPSNVLKALYANQLLLDTLLPLKLSAYCRVRAEQKHVLILSKLRKRAMSQSMSDPFALLPPAGQMHVVPDNVLADLASSSASISEKPPTEAAYLFLAPIDVTNLQPSFGAHSLQCQVVCNAWSCLGGTLSDFDGTSTTSTSTSMSNPSNLTSRKKRKLLCQIGATSTVTSASVFVDSDKVMTNGMKSSKSASTKNGNDDSSETTAKTFAQFRQSFAVPLNNLVVRHKSTAPDARVRTSAIAFEAVDSSLFKMSLGGKHVALTAVHSCINEYLEVAEKQVNRGGALAIPTATTTTSKTSPIEVSNIDLVISGDPNGSNSTASSAASSKNTKNSNTNSSVTIRVMSMLVHGNAEQLAAARDQFLKAVDEAVAERKIVLDRTLQQFADSSLEEDDDDEDGFILDPTKLTFQQVSVSGTVSALSVSVYSTYLHPVEFKAQLMAEQSVIPASQSVSRMLSLSLHSIAWEALGASNPWNGSGSLSCDCIALQLAKAVSNQQNLLSSSPSVENIMDTVLSLPRIRMNFSIQQISTMGRRVDGALDSTCFDIASTFDMYPFTLNFHPLSAIYSSRNMSNTDGQGSIRIWNSERSLGHLTLPFAQWCRNIGNSCKEFYSRSPSALHPDSATRTTSTSRRPSVQKGQPKVPVELGGEARTRLGDWYSRYPRHVNVVTELWATLQSKSNSSTAKNNGSQGTVEESTTETSKLLTEQELRLRCLTAAKGLDLNIAIPTPTMASIIRHSKGMGGEPILDSETHIYDVDGFAASLEASLEASIIMESASVVVQSQTEPEAAVLVTKEAALEEARPSSSLFGWFGSPSKSASVSSRTKSSEKPVSNKKKDEDLSTASLLARIAELEQQNADLKNQLSKSGKK